MVFSASQYSVEDAARVQISASSLSYLKEGWIVFHRSKHCIDIPNGPTIPACREGEHVMHRFSLSWSSGALCVFGVCFTPV